MNKSVFEMFLDGMRPWSTFNVHTQPSLEIWLETKQFEILSFLDQGLRVPAITSGPRIGPREKLSWVIEFCKVYLA